MNITNQKSTPVIRWMRLLFCVTFALALTGCYGVVGGYGYYGGPDYGPGFWGDYGPDVTIFGDYHRGGHWAHAYAHRGFASRSAIGGHFGGHAGGGRR